ncbi:PQQ-dependent sugar dehydrogenase [Pontibacter liquoris]|uniref:PQQ-dependent sugar dehydrogenase n=1 Tax=Pontibacter liquoris TaxID=2905677 RepID=UPI001FA6AA5A|nr:PQQ-dependent sugar dehydrogenase [Pontibacter liquoris]
MRKYCQLLFSAFFLMASACTAQAQYTLKEVYPGLELNNPTELISEGNQTYAVAQEGIIYSISSSGKKPFLNITDRVVSGGERGLLGLAFHPDFRKNGYFYVNYTSGKPLHTRISRFTAKPGTTQADPASEVVLLTFAQPYSNHNGGKVAFGPDNYLYIGVGDGGSGGDPQNNAQDRTKLLGKILRIDVNTTSGSHKYGIPSDNPYAGNRQGFKEEIYAYGMRNPWKLSFDTKTGTLWAGDVGQNEIEEVDIIRKGGNYGWRIMEGTACYEPSKNCDKAGLIQPVHEYTHAEGASITGGYVYRGTKLPALQGSYIYGDYVSGKVWALTVDKNGKATGNKLLLTAGFPISSFGVDPNGELLVVRYGDKGKIYRLTGGK